MELLEGLLGLLIGLAGPAMLVLMVCAIPFVLLIIYWVVGILKDNAEDKKKKKEKELRLAEAMRYHDFRQESELPDNYLYLQDLSRVYMKERDWNRLVMCARKLIRCNKLKNYRQIADSLEWSAKTAEDWQRLVSFQEYCLNAGMKEAEDHLREHKLSLVICQAQEAHSQKRWRDAADVLLPVLQKGLDEENDPKVRSRMLFLAVDSLSRAADTQADLEVALIYLGQLEEEEQESEENLKEIRERLLCIRSEKFQINTLALLVRAEEMGGYGLNPDDEKFDEVYELYRSAAEVGSAVGANGCAWMLLKKAATPEECDEAMRWGQMTLKAGLEGSERLCNLIRIHKEELRADRLAAAGQIRQALAIVKELVAQGHDDSSIRACIWMIETASTPEEWVEAYKMLVIVKDRTKCPEDIEKKLEATILCQIAMHNAGVLMKNKDCTLGEYFDKMCRYADTLLCYGDERGYMLLAQAYFVKWRTIGDSELLDIAEKYAAKGAEKGDEGSKKILARIREYRK